MKGATALLDKSICYTGFTFKSTFFALGIAKQLLPLLEELGGTD